MIEAHRLRTGPEGPPKDGRHWVSSADLSIAQIAAAQAKDCGWDWYVSPGGFGWAIIPPLARPSEADGFRKLAEYYDSLIRRTIEPFLPIDPHNGGRDYCGKSAGLHLMDLWPDIHALATPARQARVRGFPVPCPAEEADRDLASLDRRTIDPMRPLTAEQAEWAAALASPDGAAALEGMSNPASTGP
jgi:hypothetical protein